MPSAFTCMPLSLSACCASRMLDESDMPLLLDDRSDEALWLIDDVSLLSEAVGELDCEDELWLAAKTAVLESTIAARVILRKSM